MRMRRLAFVVVILLSLAVLAACGGASEGNLSNYVITVSGTDGAQFHGVYMYQVDGAPRSENFDGTIPAEYNVQGEVCSCEFTLNSDGDLKVTMTKDGAAVGEGETQTVGEKVKVTDQ